MHIHTHTHVHMSVFTLFVYLSCRKCPFVFFPFGLGHRSCIARNFAMVRAWPTLLMTSHGVPVSWVPSLPSLSLPSPSPLPLCPTHARWDKPGWEDGSQSSASQTASAVQVHAPLRLQTHSRHPRSSADPGRHPLHPPTPALHVTSSAHLQLPSADSQQRRWQSE